MAGFFLYTPLCMYEKRFISGLEFHIHSQKSSTDRSLRPIVSDVQQLLMPQKLYGYVNLNYIYNVFTPTADMR